jgi:hypothetical protein
LINRLCGNYTGMTTLQQPQHRLGLRRIQRVRSRSHSRGHKRQRSDQYPKRFPLQNFLSCKAYGVLTALFATLMLN